MENRRGNHRVSAGRILFQRHQSGTCCTAFTLIELVVILGIIAVFSAILLPAMSAASEKSKRTACKSNLQAFGSAFGLFAADNNGWLPQQVGGKETDGFLLPIPESSTYGWYGHTIWREGGYRNHGHLLAYLGETSVYWCPSQSGDLTPPGEDQQPLARKFNEPLLASAQDADQIQSEYLYRKEWQDVIPRYRMASLLDQNFTILADHFGDFDGVLAVTEGHQTGYNFLRLDGAIDYFTHPEGFDGSLDKSFAHKLGKASRPEWDAFDAYAGDTEKALQAMNP